ncbi:TetR family transcriptional regulator [Candidatus Enterococcus murrayae]|uniref:TetR/AcrR family transcriptional regulator n=1 Tax=Candidatus Enterococcus murrayae TaxID=2815321 RepID=A0ABS3HET1_9ENTE|nr:TetR/AcrR family transcriptional regulator [Enterococcus sp. MJM16]
MKRSKGFSEEEKENLRNKLCMACEKSWSKFGYRKTTIGELTKETGIATGSFYLLFENKEELFLETFLSVQERLRNDWMGILEKRPNREGFIHAMAALYREYQASPFLYDFSNPDFFALLNRLSEDERKEFTNGSLSFFEYVLKCTRLKLTVPEEKAFGVLSSLLYTVTLTNTVYDQEEVFTFMLETISDRLFIEE